MDEQEQQASFTDNDNSELATLGMGCFWSPEALFGQLPGVIHTCTGYAGGTTAAPTYREMGDHTEVVQLTFNPQLLSFEEIVKRFWDSHNPVNINDYKGNQYRSLLMVHNDRQSAAIQHMIEQWRELGQSEPATAIIPYSVFYRAEDRHQKYYLQRYPDAMEKLGMLFSTQAELLGSTLAARLNGLAKGYTNLAIVIKELEQWDMDSSAREQMLALIRQIRW